MGLDMVELIITVESMFQIVIPNEEAETLTDVGRLYRYVLSKVSRNVPHRCLTAGTFYEFRRAIQSQGEISRERIRPSTRMETIWPVTGRVASWHQLGESLGWQLPELVRPRPLVHAMWVSVLAVSAGAAVCLAWLTRLATDAIGAVFFGAALTAVGTAIVAYVLTFERATEFPAGCETVRHFIRIALTRNLNCVKTSRGGWSPNEVWETLQAIIVEQFGVAPAQIQESTEFVRDLGAD